MTDKDNIAQPWRRPSRRSTAEDRTVVLSLSLTKARKERSKVGLKTQGRSNENRRLSISEEQKLTADDKRPGIIKSSDQSDRGSSTVEEVNDTGDVISPPFFAEKEFTFTGYDIMSDVGEREKKLATIPTDVSIDNTTAVQAYIQSCRRLRIIPASQIIKSIGTDCLRCRSHELGPKGAKAIAISLVKNATITEVDISDNHIGEMGTKAVSDLCSVNKNLTSLESECSIKRIPQTLSWNNISTEGARSLCRVLRDNQILRYLDISGNHLQDDAAQYVSELIEQNAAMKELSLSHNDFGEAAGILLGKAIAVNDTIEILDLSWNHLREKGAQEIGRSLKTNAGLRHLNISWNGFNHTGGMSLADSVAVNASLISLDLINNRLSPTAVTSIVTQLMVHNDNLQIIRLGMNPVTPDVAKKIITIIKDKMREDCSLREIDLGKTVVDEEFVELMNSLGEERAVSIRHGPVIKRSHDVAHSLETMYHDMDPVKAMFTFMQENGLRVVDLMQRLDSDKNQNVDREEFVEGLKKMGFPLTRQQLDDLMITMDKDQDGTVDLSGLGNNLVDYHRYVISESGGTNHGPRSRVNRQETASETSQSYLEIGTSD